MLLTIQLALYCLLFILPVKWAVKNNSLNCLYFYPKEYIEEACKRGLANQEEVMKKGKQFMIPFCVGLVLALILMISVWNQVTDFKTAYIQAYLFLVVVNWFDGIVLDRLWVAQSPIWKIQGMEGIPYIKSWKNVIIKRSLATILYLVIALVIAGIVVFIGRF